MEPTTTNLTKTFQEILFMEGISQVNYLDSVKGNRVIIRVGAESSGSKGELVGSIPSVIGKNGSGIRLIKHILKLQFGIEDVNISVLPTEVVAQ